LKHRGGIVGSAESPDGAVDVLDALAAMPHRAPANGLDAAPILSAASYRCLSYLASHPGSNGAQVRKGTGLGWDGQTSRLLRRLEREGLCEDDAGPRASRTWHITDEGQAALAQMPEGAYA
jgi:DNA-binding MarR family transcriptional regulator